jgi:hypothetical protein
VVVGADVPDEPLVLPDEPDEPLGRVGADPDVEGEPVPPLEPLVPEELEVGAGTTVTGTFTVAPVVVSTSVRVVEPPPDGLVTGIIATVEPPSDASTEGSVTTSMAPDRPGPQEGATG